jgi:hypothetical protein
MEERPLSFVSLFWCTHLHFLLRLCMQGASLSLPLYVIMIRCFRIFPFLYIYGEFAFMLNEFKGFRVSLVVIANNALGGALSSRTVSPLWNGKSEADDCTRPTLLPAYRKMKLNFTMDSSPERHNSNLCWAGTVCLTARIVYLRNRWIIFDWMLCRKGHKNCRANLISVIIGVILATTFLHATQTPHQFPQYRSIIQNMFEYHKILILLRSSTFMWNISCCGL